MVADDIKNVQINPFASLKNSSDFANNSRDADCNFDTICSWYNVNGDDFDWGFTSSHFDGSVWQNITGTSTTPSIQLFMNDFVIFEQWNTVHS